MHDFNVLGFLFTILWTLGLPFFSLIVAISLGNYTRREGESGSTALIARQAISASKYVTFKEEIKEEMSVILGRLEAIQERINSEL